MRQMTLGLVGTVSLVLVVVGVSWAVYGPTSAAPPAAVTSAAPLHEDAIVVDGHVHITTAVFHQRFHQRFDPWQVQQTGLWDYARAKQGGLNVVIEMVYIEDPYTNYNYSVKQACRLIELFYQILDANDDKMELALTSADVRRIVSDGKMAVILALEGGFDMEGDLDVLRLFHRLGVRLIQFSNHETANAMTDTWSGEQPWGGISDHGRAVIREMNRLGIMIDISHSSEKAQYQIIEASERGPGRRQSHIAEPVLESWPGDVERVAAGAGRQGWHNGDGASRGGDEQEMD